MTQRQDVTRSHGETAIRIEDLRATDEQSAKVVGGIGTWPTPERTLFSRFNLMSVAGTNTGNGRVMGTYTGNGGSSCSRSKGERRALFRQGVVVSVDS